MSGLEIANAVLAVILAIPIWFGLVRPVWPWDWKGRRKEVVIKRDPRDWE